MSTIHDVIIVGSGPAGWTAATYTGRAGLSPLVLAGTLEAGGALMNTTEVENFPGWPEPILGPELMMRMQQQAERFGAQVRYEDAISCDLASDIKTVTTADATYQAKTVILALGSEYRKLGLEGKLPFQVRAFPTVQHAMASSLKARKSLLLAAEIPLLRKLFSFHVSVQPST